MINFSSQELKFKLNVLCLLPYILFGFLVFYLNSTRYVNYLVKVYLVLLESKIGLVTLYFLIRYLKQKYYNR